jgi:hypothetical protein
VQRLALAIRDDSAALALLAGRYDFARRDVAALVGCLGERAAFYRAGPPGIARYIATARITGIENVPGEGERLRAALVGLRWIRPVDIESCDTDQPFCLLSDEQASEVLKTAVTSTQERPAHLEANEALPAPYIQGHLGIEVYQQLHTQVLRNFNYRCAITHQQFSEADVRAGRLQVIPILVLADSGAVHVTNFLPLCVEAAEAFSRGHIGVGGQCQIWADLGRAEPAPVQKMQGLLLLPEAEQDWPSQDSLSHHLRRALGLAD